MRHWLSFGDWTPEELSGLIESARRIKGGAETAVRAARESIGGKILGMVFFNPSLRTRTSFEAAMLRFGGHAICLNVGGDTWSLEHRDGVVMDGERAEHIREAAPVLGRYCDALAVRTFAGMKNAEEDAADALIRGFARFAGKRVINMESAIEHPCQGLADWMTVEEKFGGAAGEVERRRIGGAKGVNFTLTWAPQAKGVPMAVPHSAALAAAAGGMNVTIAHPPGYELNAGIMDRVKNWCAAAGSTCVVTNDQMSACAKADVVYVKSWGSASLYGKPEAQKDDFRRYASWMVDVRHLARRETILMHCLPVRRNVVISDAALDDPRCVVVDQAENRLWAQAAILARLLGD